MKLGTLGSLAVAALAGSIIVSVASSRQPAPVPTAQPPAAQPAAAQQSAARQPDNLQRVLDTFRSDLNASKVRTLNQVMQMTAAEAAAFWPLYQKYETDLTAVNDRRVTLLKQFVTLSNQGTLTDDNASALADQWLKVQQDRLDLWKKYNKEIGSAVSPIRAAQFLQVEHQVALLVDINIASEMPTVGHPK